MAVAEILDLKVLNAVCRRLPVDRADAYLPHLASAMEEREISSPLRVAHFLAQLAHESSELRRWEEGLSYSKERLIEVWPHRFLSKDLRHRMATGIEILDAELYAVAAKYERKPRELAEFVYGGRMGNGPQGSGDGWNYRGRCPIMRTGRDAYGTDGRALGLDLLENPDLLLEPEHGFRDAALFWHRRDLNCFADADDLREITRRVNGGFNGLKDRRHYLNLAKAAIDRKPSGRTF
jgi:putative chitinase